MQNYTKRTFATSGLSCQTVCVLTVSICQVNQFSFDWNRQSLLSPGVNDCVCKLQKRWETDDTSLAQDYSKTHLVRKFLKVIPRLEVKDKK